MPLHLKSTVRPSINADTYGTQAADVPVPKYKLGRTGLRPDVAHSLLRDELFLDGNAIGVMPTFGVTFTCHFEAVAEPAAALDKLQADTGLDLPMHVDAASGGFIAPFIEPVRSPAAEIKVWAQMSSSRPVPANA